METDKLCAYCGMTKPLTKEHLVPSCLLKRTNYTVNFLDASPSGVIGGEQTIRDVCKDCNSGVLSSLDNYVCRLYDLYFHADVTKGEQVRFVYDYDLLSRWLLKTSFNVSRTKRESDAPALSAFVQYINDGKAPKQLAIFLQLISPRILTVAQEASLDAETRDALPLVDGRRVIPTHQIRVAKTKTPSEYADLLCRLVSINAFYFYLVTPRAERMLPKEWQQLRRKFATTLQGAVQLTLDSSPVTVTRSKIDIFTLYAPTMIANWDRFKKGTKRKK